MYKYLPTSISNCLIKELVFHSQKSPYPYETNILYRHTEEPSFLIIICINIMVNLNISVSCDDKLFLIPSPKDRIWNIGTVTSIGQYFLH